MTAVEGEGAQVGLEIERHYAGRQSIGRRPNQQDAYGVVPPEELGGGASLLAVLADGMGGHAAGELASELALRAFVDGFFSAEGMDDPARLWKGLEAANRAVGEEVGARPELGGMGTTLLSVLVRDDGARWISVGDSPLFLYRAGELRRMNELHVAGGEGGQKGGLSSAVVGERLYEVDDQRPIPLEDGDVLVLASDGIDSLDAGELAEVLEGAKDEGAGEVAARLLRAVAAKGLEKQDNTTVVVVRRVGGAGGRACGEGGQGDEDTVIG
jgi:PPM family protein phosphatase